MSRSTKWGPIFGCWRDDPSEPLPRPKNRSLMSLVLSTGHPAPALFAGLPHFGANLFT